MNTTGRLLNLLRSQIIAESLHDIMPIHADFVRKIFIYSNIETRSNTESPYQWQKSESVTPCKKRERITAAEYNSHALKWRGR